MSFTVIKPKTRAEWLTYRENGIGSSEVATILGLNPWETPYQLWRRKIGMDPAKQENFAMKAGHYLEDAVSLFYADKTGKEIIKSSAGDWLVVNNEKPWIRVSPDRTFWIPGAKRNHAGKGILECKTTQMQIEEDNVPMHWFCQLQYQLGGAELEQGALAWLTMGREFGSRDYTFDRDFYTYLVDEVDRFWKDNILGHQEPLPVSVDDILLKNPMHVIGKSIRADDEMMQKFRDLKEIKDEISALDTRKKEIESFIKIAMNDAEAVVSELGGKEQIICTWKTSKESTKFNEKKFEKDNPELYNQYVYTVPGSRRFILK